MKNSEIVKENIRGLESAISSRLGIEVKLNVSENRNGNIEIQSENLAKHTGILVNLYKEFVFSIWGGTLIVDENKIWFNPKFFFKYRDGGSNGTDALWTGLYFNLETKEWEFGRELR